MHSSRNQRRKIRWWARARTAAVLAAPALWMLLGDVSRRLTFLLQLKGKYALFYLATLGVSFAFWALLLFVASRRRGWPRHLFAALFVALYTLAAGVQGAFFYLFHWYDSVEGEIYTRSLLTPWVGSLPLRSWVLWPHLLFACGLALITVRFARRIVRPRQSASRLAVLMACGALLALRGVKTSYHKHQAATPDMLYFHAVVASYDETFGRTHDAERVRPQPRHSLPVPPVSPVLEKPRNILFVLQESQRADVTCMDPKADCVLATRSSHRALPERMPFLRWHSLSTSTNLSCETLWTGLTAAEPKADLESAPMVFGYAKAAGYHTAYFTSQHVIYQNMRMLMQSEPIDDLVVATTLNMRANWDTGARDALLSDYVIEHWNQLPEPFLAIVHYSNQHQPYVEDPENAPFAYDDTQDRDSRANRLVRNKNVVYLSDMAVGRLLTMVRQSELGKRTAIFYTADHAEAFDDHGWSGHTTSFYEGESHVPAWLDAPEGVLTVRERNEVQDKRRAWLTHADVTPTLLDLMGILDAPALAGFRQKMLGQSLLRPLGAYPALPLTNNSWLWESSGRSWGYLQGKYKLFGTDGTESYMCFDLAQDPDENHDLGEAGCPQLTTQARALFPSLTRAERPYRPLR